MKNKLTTVAVTGGIGSGKSYALDVLKNAGFYAVSCDEVYKDLFVTQSFLRKLKKLFPSVVDGTFKLTADRKKLSEIVFNDQESRRKLNELTHPLIIKECFRRVKNSGKDLAFIEVPLLFEGGYENLFDNVIIITRNKEERINSVITRSGLSRTEIESRINAQTDYDKLDKTPYIVIENGVDFSERLLEIVKNIIK